jgi:hypothetical protein
VSAVLPFLMRFWPYLLGGLVVGLLLLRISMLSGALEDKRNELAAANASLQVQSAAVQRQRDLADAAQARADAAVAEALRVNQSQQPVIVRLRESAQRQRGAGERCEISPALREAQGL